MNRILIKIIFSLVTLLVVTSCGYFSPKSANEYTVTKKSPLVIPPDMNLVPPSIKSKNKKVSNLQISQENRGFDLEDILTGEVKAKSKNTTKKRIKTNSNKNLLVKTILRMKESVILE